MANRFGAGERSLRMSNGGTDLFLSALQFPLSDLAVSRWQRQLAQWVARHDQNVGGRGAVGFDLEEIVWAASSDDRAEQHRFLTTVIHRARARYRWDELPPGHNAPFLASWLAEYGEIVTSFVPVAAAPRNRGIAWPTPEEPELRCPRHDVHCSLLAHCRLCLDQEQR